MGGAAGASGAWGLELRSGCGKPQGAHHPGMYACTRGRAGAQMATGPMITSHAPRGSRAWLSDGAALPVGPSFAGPGANSPFRGLKS